MARTVQRFPEAGRGPGREPQGGQELTRRRRIADPGMCSMSVLIVGLDVTIVNVALPGIHDSTARGACPELQWTIDAYTLTIASLLLLSGSTGDRLRAPPDLPARADAVLAGIAAVRAWRRRVGDADRGARARRSGARCSTRWRSIIRNVFDDPRERAGAISVWGGDGRDEHGARPGPRRRARGLGRLALWCSWSTSRSASWRSSSPRCSSPVRAPTPVAWIRSGRCS